MILKVFLKAPLLFAIKFTVDLSSPTQPMNECMTMKVVTLNMFRPLCQNNNINIILLSEYKIGCFKTPPGLFSETLGDFRKESDPAKVLQCKELTREKNYTVFALGHGGLCMSGPDAQDKYYQYKPPAKARRCKNGIGIGKTSVVYTFGNYHDMFCLLFCETRNCYVVE